MNKKYTMLAIAGLLSLNICISALPALTVEQEKARLAILWNLHANSALTIAQFIENGHSAGTIIDRDIALLEKDMAQAFQQKSWAEGFILNKMIPGMFKGVAVGSGSVAALGAIFSGVGTFAGYKVWNTDNDTQMSYTDFVMAIYKEDLMGMSPDINSAEGKKRLDTLVDNNPDKDYNSVALFSGIISPFVAAASLALAGLSKYTFNKNASWNKKNADFMQDMHNRANTNQVIIAILKQLKYDNGL